MLRNTPKIILFLILFFSAIHIQGQEKGLSFQSHKVIKDQRTSLHLTPDKPLHLANGFKLEFEMMMRNEISRFGYIFRIVVNDTLNIDFLSARDLKRNNCFWLVCGNDSRAIFHISEIPNFKKEEWVHVSLIHNPGKEQVTLSINGKSETIDFSFAKGDLHLCDFYFGANDHPKFFTTDVPPIVVKEIFIKTLKDKTLFNWPFGKHGINVAYDTVTGKKCAVTNPIWIIDTHIKWQKVSTLKFNTKPQIAYNSQRAHLYFVEKKQIQDYSLARKCIADTIYPQSGYPYETQANQVIYHPGKKELWSYDFNSPEIVRFNFETRQWSSSPSKPEEPDFWHHNHIISPRDSGIISFGGYGHFRYHGLLQQYDIQAQQWKQYNLSKDIMPRYLSAAGLLGKDILLFGGFGNKTGEQQVAPNSTTDLYLISTQDFKVKKLWEMDAVSNRTQSNSLVIDNSNNRFYTLSYPKHLYKSAIQLYSYRIDKPERSIFADTIPYIFSDTESFCDLYYNQRNNEFIALTLSPAEGKNQFELNLYSLAYPPMLIDEVMEPEPSVFNAKLIAYIFIIIILFAIAGFIVYRKKRHHSPKISPSGQVVIEKKDTEVLYQFQKTNLNIQKPKLQASSLILIGGFQAGDKESKDITGLFTPTLKNIVLMILLNTIKNGKGVSSTLLQETFWFDKSEESARNNRNVNIKKIRNLLEDISGLEITNENSYWQMKIEEPFYCDYIEVLDLMKLIKEKEQSVNINTINRFISLVSCGQFLPNIQTEWLDPFKSEYSNTVVDCLDIIIQRARTLNDNKLLIQCAEVILLQDPNNEGAIEMKCYALCKMGKKGLAKTAYDLFCRDYLNMLDTHYNVSFEEVLQRGNAAKIDS